MEENNWCKPQPAGQKAGPGTGAHGAREGEDCDPVSREGTHGLLG